MDPRAQALHTFWFGPDIEAEPTARSGLWFSATPETDAELRERFGGLHELAAAGALAEWANQPRSRLALVLLFDQVSRNLHRDAAGAFAHDAAAQRLCLEGIDAGHADALAAVERMFLFMPLMHAEDLALQDRSCELFRQLAETAPEAVTATCASFSSYAERHREVIARFGRFPHRNATLGRPSTAEETAFLASGKRF